MKENDAKKPMATEITHFDRQKVIDELIIVVPEIREEYEEMVLYEQSVELSIEDIKELEEIAQMHNITADLNLPGDTIVFENVFVPQLILFVKENATDRLKVVFEWVESIVTTHEQSDDIQTLFWGSLCEPLVASHDIFFPQIFPFMGPRTLELCRMVRETYVLSEEVNNLLNNS